MPKVLIADDSLSVRKVAERLLLAAGFDVELAANGEEALASLTAGRPDIIIADVIMPDKSGFEVCAHVRSHATLSMTPVLLISGIVDDDITRQALACHADGVIKKPFHGSSLPDRVLALLASRQATVEPAPVEVPDAADNGKAQVSDNGKTADPTEAGGGLKVFRLTDDQLEKVRDVATWAKDVEARLNEEQKRSSELGEQNAAFRETALSAAARIQELETKLADEQKQSAILLQRIAEIEPAAARAEKLADIIEEIVKLGPKSRL